jgi:hypothetical protein
MRHTRLAIAQQRHKPIQNLLDEGERQQPPRAVAGIGFMPLPVSQK